MSSSNSNNEQQELLEKTLFSYVGYYHAQNLNLELERSRNEIETTEIPKSLDKWFYEYNNTLQFYSGIMMNQAFMFLQILS